MGCGGPSKSGHDALDSQIVLCKFFFVHRSLFFEPKRLPPYQALKGRRKCLKDVTISISVLERGELTRSHIIVSHRWLTKAHPDPDGVQRDAIKVWLVSHPEVEWVWLDFCCLPQETEEFKRSDEEKTYFRAALNFSNTLYLFLPVLVIADVEYAKRFWCLLEVFLAFRTFEGGHITTAQGVTEHLHMVCDGAEVAKGLEQDWKSGSVEEALGRLLEDRVTVTSQSDKLLQVARLKFLEPMLRYLHEFEAARLAHSSADAADGPAAAVRLQALGDVRRELQDVGRGRDEALAYYKEAERAYLAAGANESAAYATLLVNIGVISRDRGLHREASAYYEKAEQAYRAAGATSSTEYGNLLKQRGISLSQRGQWKQGMKLYKEAEQVYTAAGATGSVDYGNLLNSMGTNSSKCGQDEEGMAYYKKAEQVYLAADKAGSLDYASLLIGMGTNCDHRGHTHECMAYYNKAEQAFLSAGATTSMTFASLLKSRGTCLSKRDRVTEALASYKKAEQAYIAADATNTASYAGLLMSMGACLTESGRTDEGMAYLKQSERAYRAAGVAKDHPHYVAVTSALKGK